MSEQPQQQQQATPAGHSAETDPIRLGHRRSANDLLQQSYLTTLAQVAGESVPPDLSTADASRTIEELARSAPVAATSHPCADSERRWPARRSP